MKKTEKCNHVISETFYKGNSQQEWKRCIRCGHEEEWLPDTIRKEIKPHHIITNKVFFQRIRMIYKASIIGGTIIVHDENSKKQILSIAKNLGVDNIKVIIKDKKVNGAHPSLLIFNDFTGT